MSRYATFECPNCKDGGRIMINVDVLADRTLELWCDNCEFSMEYGDEHPNAIVAAIHKTLRGHGHE